MDVLWFCPQEPIGPPMLGPDLGPSGLFEAGSDTPKRRGEPEGRPLTPCPGTWHHVLGGERSGPVEGLQRDFVQRPARGRLLWL